MKHEKILEQLKKLPLEAQADLLADLEQLEELKNKKKEVEIKKAQEAKVERRAPKVTSVNKFKKGHGETNVSKINLEAFTKKPESAKE